MRSRINKPHKSLKRFNNLSILLIIINDSLRTSQGSLNRLQIPPTYHPRNKNGTKP